MGLRGRLEATTAPTIGKARKSTKLTVSSEVADGAPGEGAGRGRVLSTLAAIKMATESTANDHASHAVAPFLVPPAAVRCSFVLAVTTPLYRTNVSQTLRPALRERELRPRTSAFHTESVGNAPVGTTIRYVTRRTGIEKVRQRLSSTLWDVRSGVARGPEDPRTTRRWRAAGRRRRSSSAGPRSRRS